MGTHYTQCTSLIPFRVFACSNVQVYDSQVNNSTEILPDVRLLLQWNDTRCDTVTATKLLTDMSCSGVVAFFGPEGRCHTEAIIAQSRNLPMISYVSRSNLFW